jgi:hypothetical protein
LFGRLGDEQGSWIDGLKSNPLFQGAQLADIAVFAGHCRSSGVAAAWPPSGRQSERAFHADPSSIASKGCLLNADCALDRLKVNALIARLSLCKALPDGWTKLAEAAGPTLVARLGRIFHLPL